MLPKSTLPAMTLVAALATGVFCCELANATDATPNRQRAEPEVGRMAKEFRLEAVAGKRSGEVSLSDVTGEAPVVVVVLRGFPGSQCPACAGQVADLVKHARHFRQRNIEVLLIYPGPAAELKARAEDFLQDSKLPAPFTMLLDPDHSFTQAYGLRWNAPRETAYPTTIVIGKDGKIDFVNISRTHRGRTTATTVLDQF
ncbi:putative peroxiredoxin [Rhodopirellula islandica]|uniref:thioredoxin-dependent peroxiredoxin n=1 Tax=Rhodopirellula islandica TaxID=595434 RepID=A0A0J1E9M1_RHOIS|nr:peroxiredoxin family protein [Rhodopirellula islandica]KLU02164.1 putative peroxiredoxin [Rhodopirellula islandica]